MREEGKRPPQSGCRSAASCGADQTGPAWLLPVGLLDSSVSVQNLTWGFSSSHCGHSVHHPLVPASPGGQPLHVRLACH